MKLPSIKLFKIKERSLKGLSFWQMLGMVFLIVIAIIYLYPLFWLFDSSFRPAIEIFQIPPIIFTQSVWDSISSYSFHSFVLAFTRWNVGWSFFISIVVTGGGTLLTLLVCSLCAYSFAFLEFPGKKVLFMIVLGSMMLPLVTMIVPYYKVLSVLGITNNLLGLVLPYAASAFGVFLMRQFYIRIPKALIESAKIDGCGHLKIWWHIIVPISKPAIAALSIVQFRTIWNDFIMPMIVLKSEELFTMPIKIQLMDSVNFNKPYDVIITSGFITAIIPMIVFIIFQKQFIEGLTGGVKE